MNLNVIRSSRRCHCAAPPAGPEIKLFSKNTVFSCHQFVRYSAKSFSVHHKQRLLPTKPLKPTTCLLPSAAAPNVSRISSPTAALPSRSGNCRVPRAPRRRPRTASAVPSRRSPNHKKVSGKPPASAGGGCRLCESVGAGNDRFRQWRFVQ